MIPFVREMAFEYGVAHAVSPLVRRVVANNPGPFTFTGTGTYIVGRGEVAVIDPGPDLPEHLDAILAAVAGERVTHVLATHTHADHSPLCGPLAKATGALVAGLPSPGGHGDFEEAEDAVFRPDMVLSDGQRIAGPGWALEAMTTPGHASNHICFALAEENALFSGDHIMGWSTTVVGPPDGNMTDYYASLDKVQARDFSRLIPCHGPAIEAPGPFIDAYRAHRLAREAQIEAELAKGPARIRDMVPSMYAAVDPRLHPAAAHSVFAHLIHMAGKGRVVTDGEPRMDGVYRLG
jgi:glyoxylase-like metal-dependent hydrolase (beta-lactamase superfamily II)